MSAIANVKILLATAVAPAGTVTSAYPAGIVQADLTGTTGGKVAVDHDVFPQAASGAGTVAITFGASNITLTNNSGVTWPVGATVIASFGSVDIKGSYNLTWPKKVQDAALS